MLILIAAGNAGSSGANPKKADPGFVDWLSIGSPGSCKNALTVGASRSNRTDGAMSSITWGTGWPKDYPVAPIANERILPDALTLPDPDNNLESIRIETPPPGAYFLQVVAANLLKQPQDFALVASAVGLPNLTEV